MRYRVRLCLIAAIAAMALLCLLGCSHGEPFIGAGREWRAAAFGSQGTVGTISLDEVGGHDRDDVLQGGAVADIGMLEEFSSAVLETGEAGEVSDNDDGYQIVYTTIDPLKENFRLSATFEVVDVGERAGSQTGFGVCATDLAGLDPGGSDTNSYRYFNSVSCLAMDAPGGTAALRGVHGYVDPDASNPEIMRRCNAIEPFGRTAPIEEGAEYRFELEKTDEGFTGRFDGEELSMADEGFVAVQDDGSACVGVFAARNITVKVTDAKLETSPAGTGAKVKTAKDVDGTQPAYKEFAPVDYRPMEEIIASSSMAVEVEDIVCAAPDGKPEGLGTSTYPLDLATALAGAKAGQSILLKPGTYALEEGLRLDASGTRGHPIELVAAGNGVAVLEGNGIEVAGDWWHLRGIEVTGAPGVGILVSGNDNVIERCTIHGCGDTGLQITDDLEATEVELRESRDEWPARNLVVNCDSFDNCDEARQDADGFAAKLACGEGNIFYACIAHHNVDDGWDLYSKTSYGPIGAVRLENCVAYGNGRTSQDEEAGSYAPGEGNGFKLGGRDVPVGHLVSNSVAVGNLGRGFTTNGSPNCGIGNCTSYDNGQNIWASYTRGESGLWLQSVASLAGPATGEDDLIDAGIMSGDSVVIAPSLVQPENREWIARTYVSSLDLSAFARDPDTGSLSLNRAFVGIGSAGAHF